MKTINVYLLYNCNDPDYDQIEKITHSIQEAEYYRKQEGSYRYEAFNLTLPQEIQVQSDY